MTDNEKLAHDKALAFAQATLMSEIENSQNPNNHTQKIISMTDKANLFNYNYVESFHYFLA